MNAGPEQDSPRDVDPQSMAPSVKRFAPLDERQGVFAHEGGIHLMAPDVWSMGAGFGGALSGHARGHAGVVP